MKIKSSVKISHLGVSVEKTELTVFEETLNRKLKKRDPLHSLHFDNNCKFLKRGGGGG